MKIDKISTLFFALLGYGALDCMDQYDPNNNNNNLSDIATQLQKIKVDGKKEQQAKIKLILSDAGSYIARAELEKIKSPVLQAMLRDSWTEAKTGIIALPEIEHAVWQMIKKNIEKEKEAQQDTNIVENKLLYDLLLEYYINEDSRKEPEISRGLQALEEKVQKIDAILDFLGLSHPEITTRRMGDIVQEACKKIEIPCIGTYQQLEGSKIFSMIVDHDSIILGFTDGLVKIIDQKTGQERAKWSTTTKINCLSITGNNVFVGSGNSIYQIDKITGKFLKEFVGHHDKVYTLWNNQNELISGDISGELKWWNMATENCTKTIKAHSKAVSSIIVHDNNLYTASFDSRIKKWDKIRGELVHCWDLKKPVYQCILDGDLIYACFFNQNEKWCVFSKFDSDMGNCNYESAIGLGLKGMPILHDGWSLFPNIAYKRIELQNNKFKNTVDIDFDAKENAPLRLCFNGNILIALSLDNNIVKTWDLTNLFAFQKYIDTELSLVHRFVLGLASIAYSGEKEITLSEWQEVVFGDMYTTINKRWGKAVADRFEDMVFCYVKHHSGYKSNESPDQVVNELTTLPVSSKEEESN